MALSIMPLQIKSRHTAFGIFYSPLKGSNDDGLRLSFWD